MVITYHKLLILNQNIELMDVKTLFVGSFKQTQNYLSYVW